MGTNIRNVGTDKRRNGPCPLHPEHKFKKCPHGCYTAGRLLRLDRVKSKQQRQLDAEKTR